MEGSVVMGEWLTYRILFLLRLEYFALRVSADKSMSSSHSPMTSSKLPNALPFLLTEMGLVIQTRINLNIK